MKKIAMIMALALAAGAMRAERPKLMVGIVVEGLDDEMLRTLRPYMTSGGFARLMDDGVTVADLQYGSRLDGVAATAVAMTGAAPGVNGVAAATTWDAAQRRALPTLTDPEIIGNYTDATLSPKALAVSTLADELRIDTGGLGQVHAIAADPQTAILLGGHAGNSAVWIDDTNGRWAGSTWYTETPTPVRDTNHRNPLAVRADTMVWTPTLPEGAYSLLPSYKKTYAFRHYFAHSDARRFEALKASAKGNEEVTRLAREYLRALTPGSREASDMLLLGYTLQPYLYGRDADARAELIDAYLRLDRDLQGLFADIDGRGPGMSRTLVAVAGTPQAPAARRDDERWRVPQGEFSAARAMSLLKVYLMSVYGNGDWVEGWHEGVVMLNRDLARQRGVDLRELRTETASFLRRMAGVAQAETVDALLDGGVEDSPFPPARNIHAATAGDVFVAVSPGWEITGTEGGGEASRTVVVRDNDPTACAFILAPGLRARSIDEPVDARRLAPTLSRLMGLRAPNAARLAPIKL